MYGKEVEGVIRSTVLIAPDGVVAQHWPKVKAEGHAEAVRDALAALQGGAVAPAAAAKKPAAKKPAKAPAPAKKVAAKPAAAKKAVAKAAAKPAAKAAAKKAK
jgi:hypothetical protein